MRYNLVKNDVRFTTLPEKYFFPCDVSACSSSWYNIPKLHLFHLNDINDTRVYALGDQQVKRLELPGTKLTWRHNDSTSNDRS